MGKLILPASIVLSAVLIALTFRIEVMQVGRAVLAYDRLSGKFTFCSPRMSDGEWHCREERLLDTAASR